MTDQNKNKVISAVATALIMVVIVLICWGLGLYKPNPPIPEAGVEVNLGNSDMGLGDAMEPSSEESEQTASTPTAAEENVISQTHEQTTSVPNTKTPAKVDTKKPTQEEPKNEVKPEATTNQNALFRKKNTTNGGSEGVTQGSGNQGKEGGDPNSKRYDGTPGNGGSGWSLAGRSNLGLPKPPSSNRKEGKIIVKIWVDRSGRVTQAEAPVKGSTITERGMVEEAKSTALKAKFSASESAPETQTGTITYVYTMQ